MNRNIVTFVAAALFATSPAFCANASNAQQKSNAPQAAASHAAFSKSSNPTTQPVPEGFVLLEEDVVYTMADQPQQHLLRAHEQMVQNNPKAAASELRLAANYIRMQEARRGVDGKQLLKPWRKALMHLAERLSTGKAKTGELVKTAADTSYALAKYFNQRAVQELQANHEVAAGYDLKAAAGDFEQALIWAGEKAQDKEIHAIAASRAAANRLINAQNLVKQSAGEAQTASGKISPSDQQAEQSAGKSADHLLNCIDAQSGKFSPKPIATK